MLYPAELPEHGTMIRGGGDGPLAGEAVGRRSGVAQMWGREARNDGRT